MKNNLFLTTALIATAFVASNAMATSGPTEVSTWSDLKNTIAPAPEGTGTGENAKLTDNIAAPENPLTRALISANVTVDFNGNYIGGSDSEHTINIGGDDQIFWISSGTTTFENAKLQNISGAQSGAIKNHSGNTIFNNNTTFENITGAPAFTSNSIGTNTFNGITNFTNNKIALHLSGGSETTFNELATFSGNGISVEEDSTPSALYNADTLTFNKGIQYINNGDSATGRIGMFQNSGTTLIKGDAIFKGTFGQAIQNEGSFTIENAENIEISGSTESAFGSTAGNTASFTAKNITISNNTSENSYGNISNMGATLYILGDNNTFTNNKANGYLESKKANFGGGALQNRGLAGGSTVVIGKETSTNLFDSNTSASYGGAIHIRPKDGETATTTINGTTTFSNNTAALDGGAISNYAQGSGTSTLTFNGNTIFEGNTDGNGANDIYNTGTITFNGDVTLDGGITGNGTVNFASGKTVTVKAGKTAIENTVITNGATLSLNLDNGFTGTYEMVTNGGAISDDDFTIANNTLYNINKTDTKGTYDVSKKSSAEVATETGASQNQAAAVTAITNGEGNNATFNAIAENISDLMQSGSAVGVQLALEAAETLAPEVAPVILQTATENVGQIFSAVSARLSGGAATAPNSRGMASGDSVFENGAVWAQGLYNHSKLNDTRKAKGYKADSNGLAFGFEKQINENVKAGIGYAYTKTDVDGYNRDLDIDTHTALVYGEYKPSAWFVNAMASYSWSDYDEDKRVLGQKITGDYDAQSYALQAMSGYEFAYDNTIFTPEAGLRYIHISQDGHKDTAGQYVYGSEVDTLTGIAGLRVEQAYALDNGWTLRPSARFAVTYDIANDDGNSAALLANGTAYSVKGEAMDRFGMEADFALTADISENASVSLGYQGKFRDDYKDHTGLLNLKYNF